jgi:RpiB/LacA/LacB family sugar-phosphate isomerase
MNMSQTWEIDGMRIGIAADHGGYTLKNQLLPELRNWDCTVVDFGADEFDAADDYPDFVVPLARSLVAGELDRGIAICGSGVGASIAANKVAGVRAALIHDGFSARQGVEDDDMNLICLGARAIGPSLAIELVRIFLHARFSGAERHLRRLAKVTALEEPGSKTKGGPPCHQPQG